MDQVTVFLPGLIAVALGYVCIMIFLKIIERDAQEFMEREYPWYGKTVHDWIDAYKSRRK